MRERVHSENKSRMFLVFWTKVRAFQFLGVRTFFSIYVLCVYVYCGCIRKILVGVLVFRTKVLFVFISKFLRILCKVVEMTTLLETTVCNEKTVITNLDIFCNVLQRHRKYLCKFIEWELGICVDENNKCSDRISQEEIDKCAREFMKHFVICENCLQSDTNILTKVGKRQVKKSEIYFDCNICEHQTPVRHERLASLAFENIVPFIYQNKRGEWDVSV